jgi:hypothetical protein
MTKVGNSRGIASLKVYTLYDQLTKQVMVIKSYLFVKMSRRQFISFHTLKIISAKYFLNCKALSLIINKQIYKIFTITNIFALN